ncbi:MAG TPA: hypothetical protein VFN26_08440 [Candidatus Acidoferrum sp.]|nr:hypothetical protein [Candidatus Acidoferrum sp.]
MATGVIRGSNPRYENLFFSGMAGMFLAFVFIGFARTYYLAGLFRAPLPNLLLHIHGAVFSSWILLLITQTSLVAARRVDVHRRLGLLGFGLACLMVVLGVLAAGDQLARHTANPGTDTIEEVRAFYAIPLGGILMFATFVTLGFRNRFHPAVHKRLMLFATMALLSAAFDRWPIFEPYSLPVVHIVCSVPLLLLIMGYDWWSTGRVQRVTLWSSAFLLVVQQGRHLIGHTAAWQSFAAWVATHSPSFR